MFSYRYLPLPSEGEYIRLLSLLPNENEAEPLQCKLHNYSLKRSDLRPHRYEALSYVWGNPHETLPIYVDKDKFPVTTNLHAALSRLRDHSLERIIWVDAICINQNNPEEQGQQVQLMAKIYSNAYCVIVWLGRKAEDTDGALEAIELAANTELMERSKKEINQQAILSLLRQQWFQRIWVLQEVATARHVVIMCGSTVIEGYAFCLGVNSLNLAYMASPGLQTLPSITHLIERAGLRSKHTANLSERFSLAELVDMFHTRQATDTRDKVYALLGMSCDDPGETGLQPDYEISWKELFPKLINFVLGKHVSVEIPDDSAHSQRAVIKSKGCILAQVSSVRIDKKQHVNITFTSTNRAWCLGNKMEWTLQSSAKPIQEHDIVCLLQGALKPTIIRLYKDHFFIIVVAVTPFKESVSHEELVLSKSIIDFPRDFLLVWDWEQLSEESQDREESKNWTSFDQVTKIWNVALILGDLKEYEKEEQTLQKVTEGYKITFGKKESICQIRHGLIPLSLAAMSGDEVAVKLLLESSKGEIDEKPLLLAAKNGHEAVVKLLLDTSKVEVNSKDTYGGTPLSLAAENGHETIVKLLLETGKVEIDSKDRYGDTLLLWAARNGHEAIVKFLLETSKVEVDSKSCVGQPPLMLAAKFGHETIVKLLLDTSKVEINSKDTYGHTPLSWAARNGHEAIVKLLLDTGKVEVNSKDFVERTPLLVAAMKGHETIVKLLLDTGKVEINSKDIFGDTPRSRAARYGRKAIVQLLDSYIK